MTAITCARAQPNWPFSTDTLRRSIASLPPLQVAG